MILYRATIGLPPISKKNHQRIMYSPKTDKRWIAPSTQYERYERDALRLLPKAEQPISTAVNVKLVFFMPNRRRVDLVNLIEAANDILVRRGVLLDDHSGIIVSHDGSRVLYDRERPRTEIEIEEVEIG